jgi:hypothetical protein
MTRKAAEEEPAVDLSAAANAASRLLADAQQAEDPRERPDHWPGGWRPRVTTVPDHGA